MRRIAFFTLLSLACLSAAQERAPLLEGMGDHTFPVTTKSEEARDFFNQGLVLSYGFNHEESHRSFMWATTLDPDCAMAYWGAAYVLGPNINGRMSTGDGDKARGLAATALAKLDDESDLEKALVIALQKRYEAGVDRSTADKNYAAAMREVVNRFPNNAEALTLLVESLMDLHPWNYWTREKVAQEWTKEIIETLDRALAANPRHPGACHFMVHLWEDAPTPERAEKAADTLGSLAPGVEHLVHMPAHVLFRIGRYHDGTELNIKATIAYDNYVRQCGEQGMKPIGGYEMHDYDFTWAGATFEGRSSVALASAQKFSDRQRTDTKLIHTRIRFGKWDDLMATRAEQDDSTGYKAAIHYGRALAQLRLNSDTGAAQSEYAALLEVIGAEPRSNQYKITRDIVAGEIAAARRDYDSAVRLLEAAKKVEDGMFSSELANWHQPVRLVLGKVLLDAGRPVEAEAAYRECLKSLPNLGWALYGLMQSLEAQGKSAEAAEVNEQFTKAWQYADVVLGSSRF